MFIGDVVPAVVHLPDMVAEEVEAVCLRNINEQFLYPIKIPRKRSSVCIREKPVEGDVAAFQENAFAVEIKI